MFKIRITCVQDGSVQSLFRTFSDHKPNVHSQKPERIIAAICARKMFQTQNFMIQMFRTFREIGKLFIVYAFRQSFWLFVLVERKHIFGTIGCAAVRCSHRSAASVRNRYERLRWFFVELWENFECNFARNNIFYYFAPILKLFAHHWNYRGQNIGPSFNHSRTQLSIFSGTTRDPEYDSIVLNFAIKLSILDTEKVTFIAFEMVLSEFH